MRLLTPFKVGLVTLAGIAVFVGLSLRTTDSPIAGRSAWSVYAVFETAQGLIPESRVQIAGIPVGEIAGIDLVDGRARVHIRLKRDIVLHDDASVKRVQETIMGVSLLSIDPGTPGRPAIPDGGTIATIRRTATTEELFDSLGRVASNLGEVTGSLRDLMHDSAGREGSIEEIVRNVASASERLDRLLERETETIGRILEGADRLAGDASGIAGDNRADVRAIVADLRQVSAGLREATRSEGGGDVRGSVERINRSLDRLQQVIDKLDGAADSARSVAAKIDSGEGTVGRLINDPAVAGNVASVVENASDFLDRFRRLEVRMGLRADYYPRAEDAKTFFSLKLMPRPNKFYLLQLVSDPKGKTNYRTTIVQSTDPSEPAFVSTRESVTTNELKFSLLYGQRFGFATFRFGLMENTGGLGLDLHFVRDILNVTFDVFEFGLEGRPRIRSALLIEPYRHFFISGGADDLINPGTRDYFVGGGLEFTDEDLKYYFTSIPLP